MNGIYELANHNSLNVIKAKLIEECNEVIEAIESGIDEHILEELADVSVLTKQYVIKSNSYDEYNEWRGKKVKRQMRRFGI